MSYQHKPDSGSIFRNDKREKDTQPQMKGDALIDGVEYWVSAWTNQSQNSGERYQALKFTRKDEAAEKGMASVKATTGMAPASDIVEDDIPF